MKKRYLVIVSWYMVTDFTNKQNFDVTGRIEKASAQKFSTIELMVICFFCVYAQHTCVVLN